MTRIPNELRYTQTHEWLRLEEDGSMVVGITDHAQSQLGELLFVDLPDQGARVNASDEVAVLESVKATSELYSPISGKVVAINEDLEEAPSFVNSDPYGDGWLFKIQPIDPAELTELLDAEGYGQLLEEDED